MPKPMFASQAGEILRMLATDMEILTRVDCRDMVLKERFLVAKQKAVEGVHDLIVLFTDDLRRTAMRTIEDGRAELK